MLQPRLVDRVLSALLAPGTWTGPMPAAASAATAAQQEGLRQTDLGTEAKRNIADLAEAMLQAPDCLERAGGRVNSERTSAFVQLRFVEEVAALAHLQQERPAVHGQEVRTIREETEAIRALLSEARRDIAALRVAAV